MYYNISEDREGISYSMKPSSVRKRLSPFCEQSKSCATDRVKIGFQLVQKQQVIEHQRFARVNWENKSVTENKARGSL